MVSNRPWSAFELVDPESGLTRIVIRMPDGAGDLPQSVTVTRGYEPRFLTSCGWVDTAEELPVAGSYTSVDAQYMAFDPVLFADVEDYELIEIRMTGTDLSGVTAWPPEPAPPESIEVRAKDAGQPRPDARKADAGDDPYPVFGEASLDDGNPSEAEHRSSETGQEQKRPPFGGMPEPWSPFRWPWWIWLVLGTLVLALIVALVLWFDEAEVTKVAIEPKPVVIPPPPPLPPPCETDEACFRAALEEGDYATGRRLLDGLVVQGSPGIALIAAEALSADPFEPGLYNTQDHRKAYQYYRNACSGGAKARASVAAWAARLADTESPTATIVQAAGKLIETCKD